MIVWFILAAFMALIGGACFAMLITERRPGQLPFRVVMVICFLISVWLCTRFLERGLA